MLLAAGLLKAGDLTAAPSAAEKAIALFEWRAELATVLGDTVVREQLRQEAERGYQQIGAPLHKQRLAAARIG